MTSILLLKKIAENSNYDFVEKLGSGSFADVVKVEKKSKYYAMKVFKEDTHNGREEWEIHKRLSAIGHPNIICVEEFNDTIKFMIVMELAEVGTLQSLIDIGPLSVEQCKFYFRQLITGVEFIHSQHIAHLDLKPENLFLTNLDSLKIGDFGFATNVLDKKSSHCVILKKIKSGRGSPAFKSPESSQHNKWIDGKPADIWSVGMVLLNMLLGYLPWDTPCTSEVEYNNWVTKSWNSQDEIRWDLINPGMMKLLSKILEPNVTKRATVDKIKNDLWFSEKKALPVDKSTRTHIQKKTFASSSQRREHNPESKIDGSRIKTNGRRTRKITSPIMKPLRSQPRSSNRQSTIKPKQK